MECIQCKEEMEEGAIKINNTVNWADMCVKMK